MGRLEGWGGYGGWRLLSEYSTGTKFWREVQPKSPELYFQMGRYLILGFYSIITYLKGLIGGAAV